MYLFVSLARSATYFCAKQNKSSKTHQNNPQVIKTKQNQNPADNVTLHWKYVFLLSVAHGTGQSAWKQNSWYFVDEDDTYDVVPVVLSRKRPRWPSADLADEW